MTNSLDDKNFSAVMERDFAPHLQHTYASAIAVALSGGPDSMALLNCLSRWSAAHDGPEIHALIVDHGLRSHAQAEAAQTKAWVETWPRVQAHILTWDHDGVPSRIQEEARQARYDLMAQYCADQKIAHLFLGHHRDDQAETFLFRLAKGSGLDGLAGMNPVTIDDHGLALMRPFLSFSKDDILAFCAAQDLPFIEDPSNDSERFARVRLRQSAQILEQEGLSAKRLALTAARLLRARGALEEITREALESALKEKGSKRIVLNLTAFQILHEEIALRIVQDVFRDLCPQRDYLPRMEKIEDLVRDLLQENTFRKRTLGGLIFERNDQDKELIISKEK